MPQCLRCRADMVVRRGPWGLFYGCIRYPLCTGARNHREDSPKQVKTNPKVTPESYNSVVAKLKGGDQSKHNQTV